MNDKPSIFIVADDLTGSADAANYFRTAERRVRVSFIPEAPWTLSLGTNVVQVFDSESRALDITTARQRMSKAGQQLAHLGDHAPCVYKKVDSTLRGHIGGEIDALLNGLGRRFALLAPSFPANGRIVQAGKLLVDGVPISQTPIAKDPHNPVTFDKVADIVRQTTSLPVVELDRAVVVQGSEAIGRYLAEVRHDAAIVVADAQTDDDLAIVAQAVAERSDILPCGSAGLARQLAAIWCQGEATGQSQPGRRPACTKVLVAVGSANPVSHNQLNYVTSALSASTVRVQPLLLAESGTRNQEMARAEREIGQANTSVVAITFAKDRARRNPGLPGSFESDLAQVADKWLRHEIVDGSETIGFVATGGDTALAICKAMSVQAIWPEGEIVSGMPWSRMETDDGEFPMVSKAGGFGKSDALQQAVAFLMNQTA